jgi:predicted nucleic acid-binding protein
VSKTIFLDTLFFVALVNERDQYHQRADELSLELAGRRFLTTDAVLLEIGNSLARSFKDVATETIHDLLTSDDTEVVRLTPALFEEGFDLYRTHRDKEWGLVDCVSFVVMRKAGNLRGRSFRLADLHGNLIRRLTLSCRLPSLQIEHVHQHVLQAPLYAKKTHHHRQRACL